MSTHSPIFCCSHATPIHTSLNNKPHQDPNRPLHDAIFKSFLEFAARRQRQEDFLSMLSAARPKKDVIEELKGMPPTPPRSTSSVIEEDEEEIPRLQPAPELTLEAFENNPLTTETLYVIHLTSRHNFGFVYSHRYFTCPKNLNEDWAEMSLIHWFARGKPFELTAENWDLKCEGQGHERFFRLELRPNLDLRCRQMVTVGEAGVAAVCG